MDFRKIFLCAVAAVLACFAIAAFIKGLTSLIARKNIANALMCIRAKRWELLQKNIKLSSYRWRFSGRKYILVVGLFAREKLASPEVIQWRQNIENYGGLEKDIEQLADADSSKLEEYLANQCANDTGLMAITGALISTVGGAVVLAIVLSVIALLLGGLTT